jgi:hypothetical protein
MSVCTLKQITSIVKILSFIIVRRWLQYFELYFVLIGTMGKYKRKTERSLKFTTEEIENVDI